MNLFKNTLVLLFVSAVLACSGNNQSNSAATTANNNANPNNAAAAVNNNAAPSKAETNVYKDYPVEVSPKTVVADDDSKTKKLTPKKPNSEKAETVKKTEPVLPSSDDENAFKFSSSKRINSAARTMKKRIIKPDANVKETELNQKKDETDQP